VQIGERIRRHRKDNRAVFAAALALFVVLGGVFFLVLRSRDLPSYLVTDQLLLFVLWYVNGALTLAVLFVLLRSVYKLLVERHHRILGSKFKTKLVATFVGLSLIPVLLLFVIATELLQGSVDRWFDTDVREVREQGYAVSEALSDRMEQTALRDAARVRREIADLDLGDPAARPELVRRLRALLAELQLDLLTVYDGRDFVQAVADPRTGLSDLPEPPRDLLAEAAREGRAVRFQEPPGLPAGVVLAAAGPTAAAAPPSVPPLTEPFAPAEGEAPETGPEAVGEPAAGDPDETVVVAGIVVDPLLAEQTRELREAYFAYRQLDAQRDNLEASHLLTFLMVTLLILLASSWVGLYLARRVTVPIQALAEGTRRIGLGDLDHRVEVAADDELGVLVESFNRMTQELKRNKEVIERSNAELVEANRRIAEERALIGAVLANVAAGVISIDAEGRIFTCNDAALHMLRQGESDVLGRPVAEAWADRERAKLAAIAGLATSAGALSGDDTVSLVPGGDGGPPGGGFPARGEGGLGLSGGRAAREVHLLLGGEWKVLEVKRTPMTGPDGEPAGQVLVLEDLTELIKAQQLAAWSEAARRIAHEIKNPLTPIRLSAERLLRKHRQGDGDLGPALEEGVETIVREVATLQGMVDEFSRYARMPRPHPRSVELGPLVADTLDLYRGIKEGVEVSGDIDPATGEVSVDPQQLRRALINLLDNAIEAVDPPGRVTVSAHRANGHVEIHVADTGRGIPPDAKDKLFLPYYSTKGRGTGLGLAIVHRIVTDHHGTIRVEDNRPQGTVFTLELPQG